MSSRESSPLKRSHENNHNGLITSTNGDNKAEITDRNLHYQTNISSMQFSEIESLTRTHRTNDIDTDNIIESRGIVDPSTGRILTVGEAISLHILDVRNGKIVTSIDKKQSVLIKEAVRLNLIDTELANRLLGPCGVIENSRRLSLLEAIQRELFVAERGDDRVKVTCNSSGVSVVDAMKRGLLDPETGQFITDNNEKITIEDAYRRGYLVRIDTMVKIKRGSLSLADAISQNLVDERGFIIDRNTGDSYLLDDAIERGIIDSDIREIIDTKNDMKITINDAIKQGIINPKFGHYIHQFTMEKLNFKEAKRRKFIVKPMTLKDCVDYDVIDGNGKITSPAHEKKLDILEAINVGVLDADNIKSVLDTQTGDFLTLSDALATGVIIKTGHYRNRINREKLKIHDAVNRGFLTSVAIKSIFDIDGFKDPITGEFISLNTAILKGLISSKSSGSYVINVETGKTVTFNDAIEHGHARPEVIEMLNRYIGVTENDREIRVIEAVLFDLLDPKTGQLLDPRTKKIVPLEEAIKRGLITPDGAALLASLLNITITVQTVSKKKTRCVTMTETGETINRNYEETSVDAWDGELINETTSEYIDLQSGEKKLIKNVNIANVTCDSPAVDVFGESHLQSSVSSPRVVGTKTTVISHKIHLPIRKDIDNNASIARSISDLSPNVSSSNSRTPSPTKNHRKINKHISTVVLNRSNDDLHNTLQVSGRFIKNDSSMIEKKIYDLPSGGLMLSDAIEKKIFDPVTGLFIIPGTDRLVSFEECVKLEIINPNSALVIDPKNGRNLTLLRSLEKDILDSTGHYTHPQKISMKDAISKDLVILQKIVEIDNANVIYESDKIGILNVDDPSKDVESIEFDNQFILDPIQVTPGIIYDPKTALVISSDSGKSTNILTALNEGTLKPESVIVKDPQTGSEITLKHAVDCHILNPKTGVYIDDSGRTISLKDAAKIGLIAVIGTPLIAAVATVEAVQNAITEGPETVEKRPREVAMEDDLITPDKIHAEIATSTTFLQDPKIDEEISPKKTLGMDHSTQIQFEKLVVDETECMEPGDADKMRDRITVESKNTVIIGKSSSFFTQSPNREGKPLVLQKMKKRIVTPKEAVEYGLMDTETANSLAPIVDYNSHESLTEAIKNQKINPNQGKIIDPQNGNLLTFLEAIDCKILDSENSNILIPLVKSLSVPVLYRQGLLDHDGKVVHPDTGELLSLNQAIVCEIVDPQSKIKSGLSDTVTLEIAVKKGIIDPDRSVIQTSEEDLNLVEATNKNIFDTIESKNPISLPPVGMSFPIALKLGLIDPSKKQVIHPLTGHRINLDEAIENDFFMPQTYSTAPDSIKVVQAIEDNLIDVKNATFINPKTRQIIPITQAFETGALVLKEKPKTDNQITAITETVTSYHTITTKTVQLMPGYTLLNANQVENIKTSEIISMEDALKQGIVKDESETREEYTTRDIKILFNDAVKQGLVDMNTGTFTNPETGRVMTISRAIEDGILDASSSSTIDSSQNISSNNSMTILEAVDQIYDEKTEKFLDPKTNTSYNLTEAINVGLIEQDSVVYNVKSGAPITTIQAIELGILDPNTGKIKDGKGDSISVTEAAKLGLLAVVAAPIFAGKIFVDAVKNRKLTMSPIIEDSSIHQVTESTQKIVKNPKSAAVTIQDETHRVNEFINKVDPIEITDNKATNVNFIKPSNSKIIINNIKLPSSVQSSSKNDEMSGNETVGISSETKIKNLKQRQNFLQIEIHRNLTAKYLAEQGVFDIESEKFLNPYTGNTISFHDFVLFHKIFDPDNVWVKDLSSKTEEYVPLREAIDRPLVNRNLGYMVNPKNGKKIQLLEAVKLDLIVQRNLAKQNKNMALTLQDAVELEIYNSKSDNFKDPESGEILSLIDAVKTGSIDPDSVSIRNPVNDEIIPLFKAVDVGIVDLNRGTIINIETKKETDLTVGFARGLVLSSFRKPISLEAAIKKGLYDPVSGKIRDTLTNQPIDIEEGVCRGIIDAFITECQDTKSGIFLSLDDALSGKLIISESGKLHDTKAGKLLPFDEALEKKLIVTTPYVPSLIDVIAQEYYSSKSGLILNPNTGDEMTVKQALLTGIVDGTITKIKDERTDKVISLDESEKIGLLDLEKGLLLHPYPMMLNIALEKGYILSILKPWTLQEALANQSYDPITGTFVIEGERLTLENAISKNLIRHDSPSVKDPRTGEVITLASAIKLGLIHSKNGTAVDPSTGIHFLLTDAMDCGHVIPAKRKISLPDAVFKGFYNPKIGHFTSLEAREWLPTDRAIKKGVIDPTSVIVQNSQGDLMTFNKAIQEKIVNPKTGTVTTMEGQTMDFVKAFEEDILLETRRPMSFNEALLKRVFDKKTGLFLDPETGAYLTLSQAIDRNIIDADSVIVKETNKGFSKKITLVDGIRMDLVDGKTARVKDFTRNNIKISLNEAYEIGLIVDNKAAISVQCAIHQGLYDNYTGKIIDLSTGRSITLHEAMRLCVISPKLSCYWDKRSEILLSLAETCRAGIVDRRSGMFKEPGAHCPIPLTMALHLGLIVDIESANFNLHQTIHMGMYDVPSRQFIHPLTNKKLTLSEACQVEMINPLLSIVKNIKTNRYILLPDAITCGIVDEIRGTYILSDLNREIDLQEAKQKGYIIPAVLPLSIEEATKAGLYQSQSGKFINPLVNEDFNIVQAINSGLIDPDTTALKDLTSGQIKSLQDGISDGTIDVQNGCVLDQKTKRAYTMDIALEKGLLVNVDKPLSIKTEQKFNEELQISSKRKYECVREYSVKEAIDNGLLDPEFSFVKEPKTGQFLTLSEALNDSIIDLSKRGIIEPKTGEILQQCIKFENVNVFFTKPLTFEKAVEKSYLDLKTAILTDPKTKKEMTLKDAVTCGIIDPDSVLIKDVQKKRLLKLPEAFRKGIMDGEKGSVLDTDTSKLYRLSKAVESGLLITQKQGITFIETLEFDLYDPIAGGFKNPFIVSSLLDHENLTLTDVLDSGLVDPSTTIIKDPMTGNIMTLLEAIKEKKIDPVAGRLLNDPDDKNLDFVKAYQKGFILAAEARVSVDVLSCKEKKTNCFYKNQSSFCFKIFFYYSIIFCLLPSYNSKRGFFFSFFLFVANLFIDSLRAYFAWTF